MYLLVSLQSHIIRTATNSLIIWGWVTQMTAPSITTQSAALVFPFKLTHTQNNRNTQMEDFQKEEEDEKKTWN